MFCQNCGKPIEEGQILCSDCAAQQFAPEVTDQAVFSGDTFELNTVYAVPEKKTPKKKGGLIAGIVALAIVAAAAIGIVCNLDSIRGFIARNFQSPQEYLVDVERDAIADFSADLTENYGKVLATYDKQQTTAAEAELHLTLGDGLLTLLESTLQQQGMTMEVDWLKDIKLSVYGNMQETAVQASLGLGLGENDLLSADVIADLNTGKGYLTIPELNSKYLCADMTYVVSPEELKEALSQQMQMREGFLKALPSEDELNTLIKTYTEVILAGIKTVEKEDGAVTVNGITQETLVLTAKITEADILNIAEAVLKQAENDENVKKVITAFGDYVNQTEAQYYDDYEPVDLYQQFKDAVPDAMKALEEAKAEAQENNYVLLKVHVDNKNQICGHELIVYTEGEQEEETISWLSVEKDKVIYTEAKLANVQITGEESDSKGYFDLTVDGRKQVALEFEDITDTSGKLRLIPSEELLNKVLSESGIPTSLLADNVALELSYNDQDGKVSYDIQLMVGTKPLLGLGLAAAPVEGGEIAIPTDALSADSETDLMQWVQDAKFNDVLDALENAGVPKDLVDIARSYVGMLAY